MDCGTGDTLMENPSMTDAADIYRPEVYCPGCGFYLTLADLENPIVDEINRKWHLKCVKVALATKKAKRR